MPYNVPEEQKPQFNKKVQESLGLLAQDIEGTLGLAQAFRPETLVDEYNKPVQPMDMEQRDMVSLTPEEQQRQLVTRSIIAPLADPSGQIPKSTAEVFSAPLNYDKVKALGFVDDNGNSTEKGELFYNLKQAGMFSEDGTINKKGIAYLTPAKEMQDVSGEWINKPENREIFDTLWKDGLVRTSGSLSEIGAGVADLLVKGVMSIPEGVSQGVQATWYNSQTWPSFFGMADNRPQELRDKMIASEYGIYEEFVKGVIGLSGAAGIAKAKTKSVLSGVLPQEVEDEADQDLIRARYDLWNAQQNYLNKDAGELAETVLNIDGAIKQVNGVRSRLGKNEFNKQYGQGAAFQQLFLSPENIVTAKFAVKAATSAPLASRIAITAQRRLAQVATQDLAIAQARVALESANSVLKKEAIATNLANRLASDISARAGANAELIARANQASQVAKRISDSANSIRAKLPSVTAEFEQMVAKRNSLATRIPETYSQKVLQTMELGRQVRAMPAKAIGATLERVGNTLSKTDTAITNFLQERGLDQMYTAAVGAAGVAGLAGSPVIGAIGAGAAALKTGKILSNYGKLFRYVGKEMENVRGQIPFWKRVAAHTAPGSLGRGVAHTFNMLDLGGVTSDVLRRTGRGVVAAAPTDLMFEYLSDGADMRPETLYKAAAESLVIGGSFAAAGGAFMGSKKRMRELSIGDEINFRRDLVDPRQKALFESIPSATRRAISTYAIANPTLNYVFKDSGASRYDVNTNTAIINVRSSNPIKALVAHETLHHTLIKNNMEPGIAALFLGDTKNNTVGGLLRSRDGKLDPNFEAFKNAYYKRLGVEGMSNAEMEAIYPLDKIAVEYFIEKHADQYASMAESGELGAIAASGAVKRKLGSVLETVLPRIPVLKDLHFKSGGMIDKDGRWVTGNGILDAEGIKSDPISKKMFRDMNRRSAGLVPGQFDPLMSDKPDSGAPIMLDPNDGIDAELLHPLVRVDETGKPILQNGKPVALDRATELERALAGLTAVDVLKRKRDANYAPEKGEAHVDAEGVFQPGWLSNDVLTEMFAKNRYNAEQKRIIREVNRLIRKGTGDRMVMVNFPATTRNKAGKIVYKPQGATLRDTVPVAITISKDGNLLFGLMSVTKLQENIQKRSQSKRGKRLYGGNVDLILRDVQAMMDYHRKGVDSIEFFKDKYGAVEADERKKFINTMFGLLNQKEQAVLNPILIEDGIKSRDNVYRTYRADRVSKAVPMSPEEYPAMPFNYEAVSGVKMPEQRQMPEVSPEDLNPVANRQEAEALFADGKRLFAFNEMDETATEITSASMLNAYPPDAIGWMEPNTEPVEQNRFMPEGVDEDKFYSQLDRVIVSKVPSKATPQQIMATIDPARGSGVKAEEIKWSGIEQALVSLEKDGKVSKDDLLKYLRNEGMVRFEEAVTGGVDRMTAPRSAERLRQMLMSEGYNSAEADSVVQAASRQENIYQGRNGGIIDQVLEVISDYRDIEDERNGATRFSEYQLPGGENYREVVLAMPSKTKPQFVIAYKDGSGQLGGMTFDTVEQAQSELSETFPRRTDLEVQPFYREKVVSEYTSGHFPDVPNYVAHMRTNERVDVDGRPGLFVEEFQSDRHQEGRKKGYREAQKTLEEVTNERIVQLDSGKWGFKNDDGLFQGIRNTKEEAIDANKREIWEAQAMQDFKGVPDAPFRTTWPLQLFKRALRDAVDSGKEWIGWTVGDTQNDRFDLGRQIDTLNYSGNSQDGWTLQLLKNGEQINEIEVADDRLEDTVGKDVSDRIRRNVGGEGLPSGMGSLEGLNLKVGGSGMRGFYDTMLPKEIGKYVKQWGGKVEKMLLPTPDSTGKFVGEVRGEPVSIYQTLEGAKMDLNNGEIDSIKGSNIWRVDITPEMRKLAESGQARFMPEVGNAPKDAKFKSITNQGRKAASGDYSKIPAGTILGTIRFMPESENERILANFPLDEDAKKKMEGKAGFAFVSDWADSNRFYVTQNGREIDVLMGGVGYTYHPEVIGKGGWAGSFSPLTNRVLKNINQTDGIGLVVAGGRDSTLSSRSFSIAALEEIKDSIFNKVVSKAAINNIIKNNAERILGRRDIKSLDDYERLLMVEKGGEGLTFDQRFQMVKGIASQDNKKLFGIPNWNDILKKYEVQKGSFIPGQIVSVVQFKKDAPLVRASDINIKGHKSYEAVIQGKPIGVLKDRVMIGDFFSDFFKSEGTLPASYTRKVQTKMPQFKYGQGSAVFDKDAKTIANAINLK